MLLQIIFIDQESENESCDCCKQPIKGKKWVMMLDFGDPLTSMDLDYTICTLCKIQMENPGELSTPVK